MSGNQLQVRNISYRLLSGIDFTLNQGETVALMGPNGAGKSTLARILAGLVEPTAGEVALLKDGMEKPWSELKRWQEIGLIGQHPRRQTLGATVAEELGFGLLNLGRSTKETREIVKGLAQEIGLGEKLNQSPATLSGGERQRLVMAAVLALKPAFLILDEALTMLDERAQETCLKLLHAQRQDMGQLWITHDPELARQADRLLIMKNGKLFETGCPEEVLDDAELCREYSLRSYRSMGVAKEQAETRAQMKTGAREKTGTGTDQGTEVETGTGAGIGAFIAARSQRPAEKEAGAGRGGYPALSWQNAEYGTRLKLSGEIGAREFIAVLGASGAGKSTLLESAIALLKPSQGDFRAFGEELSGQSIDRLRRRVRLMLQEPGEYLIGRTVYHEVFYLQSRKERILQQPENLRFLENFAISEAQVRLSPEVLSGGERQRVALAAALESLPEILLLDEPLLGLDAEGRDLFQSILRELKESLTVVYVTHDLNEVLGLADRLWLIEEGKPSLDCPLKDWAVHRELLTEAGVRLPRSAQGRHSS
jgi:energy-coupling factor transport system ATP-binding protein